MQTKPLTLTFRLGPKLREELELRAAENEMQLSEYVRNVLLRHIAETNGKEES